MRVKLRAARAGEQDAHVVRRGRHVQGLGWGLAAAVLAAGVAAADGGASPWTRVDHAALRLLAAGPAGNGPERAAAIEVRLDPGTLTYWRQPGDAGLPPRFDTSRSTNIAAVAVAYPAPALLDAEGAQLFGYKDAVVFPLRVTVADPSRPATLTVTLAAALCRDLCLPVSATLFLPLPPSADAATSRLVEAAEASVPRQVAPGAPGPLGIGAASLPAGAASAVRVEAKMPGPATLFTEGPEGWYFPAVKVAPDAGGHAAVTVPVAQRPDGPLPAQLPLVFTLTDGHAAVEVATRVDVTPSAP